MLTGASTPTNRANAVADLSPMAVQSAIEAIMRSSGGAVDSALAATLTAKIHGGLRSAFQSGIPGNLAGDPTFNRLLKEQLGNPALLVTDQQRAAMLAHTIQHSNFTSSDRAAAIAAIERQFGALGQMVRAAIERSEGGVGTLSSAERAIRLNGGPYSAGNLSDIREYVDITRGYTASQVASTGNYLYGLGIDRRYMGHFMGSSETVRNAISDHIRTGARMTDEHITNPHDVRAVMGAINSGRMKPEDAPPSVRQIMDDMRAKGIDPSKANARVLDDYFKQNPQALEAAKQANRQADRVDAGLGVQQRVERGDAALDRAAAVAKSPTPSSAAPRTAQL